MSIRVGVVGVSGYSGLELMKLLLRHPVAECAVVAASESTGPKVVSDIHPQLRGSCDLVCQPPDPKVIAEMGVETVFLCTPNEVSHELAPRFLGYGTRVVDLSGAFRLRTEASYGPWYGFEHSAPELLRQSVYGLPECHAREIATARLVANPGCYATSVILALLPLIRAGMLEPGSDICCDAKSGVTGAGRKPRLDLMFGEVSDNFRPYSPIVHRHAPEICQEIGWELEDFTFVPHLLPISRGILTTLYVRFSRPLTIDEIHAEFQRCYRDYPLIRLLGGGRLPDIQAVAQTNCCDLAWRLTARGRRGVLFSALDNLVKGAAGQAVQNFNLMHGLARDLGVTLENHC
jgi:N-acetyl-gamma-glutamyl-phosphate reductase